MKTVPFTKNREAIYDLLTRAKRYHATSSSIHELDAGPILDALRARRAAGRPVPLNAYLVKLTSLVLQQHPRLNHHLFHTPLGKRQIDFEEIACNLIMLRTEASGEQILLPVVIERSNERTVDEIAEILLHHYKTPLDELPQIQALQRLKRMPRPALKAFSYLCRSSPRFYRRFFGTYGLSSIIVENAAGPMEIEFGAVAHTVSNTCTLFAPCSLSPQPRVVDGRVEARPTLVMMLAADHYLVDGHDGVRAIHTMRSLMADPSRLDPALDELPQAAAGARG